MDIIERLARVEARSMHGQLPVVWGSAKNATVRDINGKQYIDFTSGIFVANVGHSNAHVEVAMRYAMSKTIHSYTFPTPVRAAYLERLTSWTGFDKAFLVSSGTEATEAALKLMMMHGSKDGRGRVICVDGAFHGRTLGAWMMSGGYHDDRISRVSPFFRAADIPSDTCGIMLETYQGWSAQFFHPYFVQIVAEYCQENDILLCFDEIQSGFGRTGKLFGYEHYGVKPDLICIGKGMGNGVPLSGVLGRAYIMDLPEVGSMSSTHSANPLCCAAGLAVIEEFDRLDLISEAERKGNILHRELRELPLKVLGKGMVAAVHFNDEPTATKVAYRCMEKGLLVVKTGRETVKIGPPLTIPDGALLEGCAVLKEAIGEICK